MSLNQVVEDELLYELIFGMNSTEDEGKERDQIPPGSGSIPVHLKMNAERNITCDNMTQCTMRRQEEQGGTLKPAICFTADNRRGPDMDALKNIQTNLKMMVKAEEKLWRKQGADISDYFNYGFDEESWKTYCYKQFAIRAANRKQHTKIRVQKRHTRCEENDFAHPSSGRTSIPAFRQSSATNKVTGGQPGPSSEVEGHPCVSVDAINTQVVTEMPPPSNVCSLLAPTAPPAPIYQRGPPFTPPPYRGHSEGFGQLSTVLCPSSSGVPSSPRRNKSSGVIVAAKASERSSVCQQRSDRDRFRGHRHEEHSNRDSHGDKENRSSSKNREEHMRHRAPMERGDKRHSLKDSGKKRNSAGSRGTETNAKDGKKTLQRQ